jgi:hypothetical protein
MASKKQHEEWAETCGFFCTFIETRYPGHPVPVPPGDERTFYQACGLCVLIDSDGMAGLLEQPVSERRAIFRSARKLGQHDLVENAKKAAAALRHSGLVRGRRRDHSAVSDLMRPFEDRYFGQLRGRAYARLYRFIASRKAFLPYALNCARMGKEGGNPFDPREWTAEKLRAL